MTMPIGNPFIVLMDRTMANLAVIRDEAQRSRSDRSVSTPELFEVTQAINSFLGVLLMPWERVFDMEKLNGYSNKEPQLRRLGFGMLRSSKPDEDEGRTSLGAMLTSLRHGAAHGGIHILDLRGYQQRRPEAPTPMIMNDHIAAIEIESHGDNGKGERNWGCILSVDDLVHFLQAAHDLSRKEDYVLPAIWVEHQRALRQLGRVSA